MEIITTQSKELYVVQVPMRMDKCARYGGDQNDDVECMIWCEVQ